MEELVKLLVQGAGAFTRFFDGANKTGIAAKLAFIEAHGRWCERFYARPFDQAGMDEMRAMLPSSPDAPFISRKKRQRTSLANTRRLRASMQR